MPLAAAVSTPVRKARGDVRCRTCFQLVPLTGNVLAEHLRPVGIVERKTPVREERDANGVYHVVEWSPWVEMPQLRVVDSDDLRAGGRHYFTPEMLTPEGEHLSGILEWRRARIIREPCPGSGTAGYSVPPPPKPRAPAGPDKPKEVKPRPAVTRPARLPPQARPEPPPTPPPEPPPPPSTPPPSPPPRAPKPKEAPRTPAVGARAPRSAGSRAAAAARRIAALRAAAAEERAFGAALSRWAKRMGTTVSRLQQKLGATADAARILKELEKSGWTAELEEDLAGAVRSQYVRAAESEADRIGIGASFTPDNLRAERYARSRSSVLVREIEEETRAKVRRILAEQFRSGADPRPAGRRIAEVVGLTERQEGFVRNRRAAVYSDALKEGASPADARARADAAAERYGEQVIRRRGQTIARTETIRSHAEGTQATWLEARDSGALPEESKKRWVATPSDRTCPICSDLDGQAVGLNEPFQSSVLGAVALPPAHPNCRCAVSLALP